MLPSSRRIAAVVLPSLRIELARARSPGLERTPIAVVVTDADERTLSGGTRIDDVSDEAREYGVRPGATIASAKARCHDLRVRALPPRHIVRSLEGLAEALLALGAITSPMLDRDAVLVDVTGCAHIHEPHTKTDGERGLLAAIIRTVNGAGFDCHAVIASGPEIAWAVAWGLRKSIALEPEESSRVLDGLSIDVLRLEDSTASYFRRLGIRTLGQLRAMPRASLASRMGEARATHVLALLDGNDTTPLVRFEPEETLSESISLDYGTEHTEALLFLFKGLCDRIAARLGGRCAVATRLEVVLDLDRALAPSDRRTRIVSLPLASPIQKSDELQAVLRSRFEREPPLDAPIVAVTVRVPDLGARSSHSLHLFVPESRAELALPKLVAELSALLGEAAVGTLAAVDDWRPLERSRLVRFGHVRPAIRAWSTARLVGDAPEPIRILPSLMDHEGRLRDIGLVARFEHLAWWHGETNRRDVRLAWMSERDDDTGAMVFVDTDERGQTRIRGLLD